MTDRDGWAAAQKLLADLADSVHQQNAPRILQRFHDLIPFNQCTVWCWRVRLGELTDSQDLRCFSVIRDEAGIQVESVRDMEQKAMDGDDLFGAYSTFISEEVGERPDIPAFKVYPRNQELKGFCYKPDRHGVYSALVAKLDMDGPLDEPERFRLFECNLPVLETLFERWHVGEEHNESGFQDVSLTARQRAILSLLVEGKSTSRIAHALSVSERTVSWHLHNIYRKLQVRSRQEAIVTVQKLDLLDDE